jgi:hypothetical protein
MNRPKAAAPRGIPAWVRALALGPLAIIAAAAFECRRNIAAAALLLVPAMVCALIGACACLIARTSPRRVRDARARKANAGLLIASGYAVALAAAFTSPAHPRDFGPYALAALAIAAAALIARKAGAVAEAAPGLPGTAKARWFLGTFYYNPEDPAVLVAKRFGIGYTLNFARTAAWLILAAALLISVVAILLVRYTGA